MPSRKTSSNKIKVLCVDDSATVREVLRDIISAESDMGVVATAANPYIAREMIKQHNPDVLTLDIKMPRMSGLDFLQHLMRLRPMPVLMVSSQTQPGSEATRRALELGAMGTFGKPSLGLRHGMYQAGADLTSQIRLMAATRPRQLIRPTAAARTAPIRLPQPAAASNALILIGASTGGTEAIPEVLQPLPLNCPPVLVTQHMPSGFTRSFAERLNLRCQIEVKEAEEGDRLLPGHAYIAPGDKHLKVARDSRGYLVQLDDGPEVNRHRPAVDVLFHSAARVAADDAIGVLLTGMGKDGAAGMVALREVGARTIAQDEASCVIFGMPREAIERGGAAEVSPLRAIAPRLIELTASRPSDLAARPEAGPGYRFPQPPSMPRSSQNARWRNGSDASAAWRVV